jgi:hypothetical protein
VLPNGEGRVKLDFSEKSGRYRSNRLLRSDRIKFKDESAGTTTGQIGDKRMTSKWITTATRTALALAVAFFMISGTVHAQEFRGTISGAVTDPTGAVVPGASVKVRETQTGTVNQTVSDGDGQYVVPFLLPGQYEITITAKGFQTVVRKNITLQSQEHPIVSIALPLGNATDTVNVTTDVPLIDQANASVGQVISTESVADLPLNGRTPTTLTELSEGVITTAAPQIVHPFDNNAGNSWSIGGTPNQVSEVLLDGSPDLTLLGALAYAPTQDSVQEVSIRPFDTDASFGHTIGGVINQITKQGTNRLHGSIYEFSQVSAIDSNLYFNDRNGTTKPVAHFNQYGLTVGGPVFIPKVYNGKDKLFFFFAFEKLKDSTPATTTLTVPTQSERAGDFSALLTAGCPTGYTVNATTGVATCNTGGATDPNQLYNPFSGTLVGGKVVRTAIPNNQLITAGPLNTVALSYLNLYPQPNATSGVSATGVGNYISPAPSIDNYNNEFGRADYSFGSRDHLFADFRHNYRSQIKNNFFNDSATGTTLVRQNLGVTVDNVFTVNSSTILDTRVNWTLFNEVHGAPSQAYSAAKVGLPSYLDGNSQEVQLPNVQFTTSTTVGSVGTNATSFASLGDNTSSFDPTTSYQVFTDVVKVFGRQTFKIGFDGRQYRLSVKNFGNTEGGFNFGNQFFGTTNGTTAFSPTFGGDLASFLLGLPTAGDDDINTRADYHSYYIGSFLQDDWRVNDRLTVNLGIRYDVDTPFREKFGRTVNGFNPLATNTASAGATAAFSTKTATNDGVTATVASINTLGGLTFPAPSSGAVYNNNSGFVSPRIGFSLSVNPKTVVRGGFGIFVQSESLASLAATGSYSSNALNNQQGFSASTPYVAATSSTFQTPANSLSNPFPTGFQQPVGSSLGASTFLGQAISFLAPYEHDPYSERWNLGVQRQLTSSTMFEAMYVANHALHLPIASQNLNATSKQYLTTNPYEDVGLSLDYSTSETNPFYNQLPGNATLNASTTLLSNLIVPYPQFGTAAVTEQNQTIGQSYFNSAIVHIEQRAKHGLTLTANYSFSKLIEADTFLNDEDTVPTRRISPFDHTHHFTVGSTYLLPFGKGKMFSFGGSRLMDEIFGGFVLNAIYQFQSGPPIEFSADIPLQPGVTLRQISNQPRDSSPVPTSGTGNPALSVADFVTGNLKTCPASGACDGSQFINGQYAFHYRTLPQTLSWVRADGFNNMDASMLKNFNFTHGAYMQLRFETFNTFNHPVFASPNVSSATASNFGYNTSVYSSSQPRQVQLGARIVF